MLSFLFQKTLTPLVLRLGLALIFILHGLQKVNADTAWGTNWDAQHNLHVAAQLSVAYGELLGGIALLIGFLTRFAALGIGAIMIGAIVFVHAPNGFYLRNGGIEYNFCLLIMCAALICLGPGPLSLDRLLFPPRKKPQPQQQPQPQPQRRVVQTPPRKAPVAKPAPGSQPRRR